MTIKNPGWMALAPVRASALLRLVLLAAGVCAWPAHATFIAITNASTNVNGGAVGQANYNLTGGFYGYYGAQFSTTVGGSVSGTTDTAGMLPSSWDSAQSGLVAQSATAYAATDLATGALKASIATNGLQASAGANAQFFDTLHFTVAGAGPGTITPINLLFSLDGTLFAGPNSHGTVGWLMELGSAYFSRSIYDGFDAGVCGSQYTPCVYPWIGDGGWATSQLLSETPNSIIFQATYNLVGASPTLDVLGELNLVGGGGQMALGYNNTALYGLSVPSNVSYTSDSGVFLTQQTNPAAVPEPASWSLFALAAGALGLARRRLGRTAR